MLGRTCLFLQETAVYDIQLGSREAVAISSRPASTAALGRVNGPLLEAGVGQVPRAWQPEPLRACDKAPAEGA